MTFSHDMFIIVTDSSYNQTPLLSQVNKALCRFVKFLKSLKSEQDLLNHQVLIGKYVSKQTCVIYHGTL